MLLHNARPGTEQSDAEDGYLLLTVLVMVFLMLLALSVAAPKVAKEIQRDKEQEALERGLQYRRAIQLYYKSSGPIRRTSSNWRRRTRFASCASATRTRSPARMTGG